MKKCTVYSTVRDFKADGIIIDKKVLLLAERHNDIEPAYIENNRCFYPPYYAVDIIKNMKHDLMPFSTECKWGEFDDNISDDEAVPSWAKWYGVGENENNEKHGYCNVKTGEIIIHPEWERCYDFDENYAVVEGVCFLLVNPQGDDILEHVSFMKMKKLKKGYAFKDSDEWFYVDEEGNQDLIGGVGYSDVFWDGLGELVFMKRDDNNHKFYYFDNIRVRNLNRCPHRYELPFNSRRANTYWDSIEQEGFRILRRGDKFGLIRDVTRKPDPHPLETWSELVLEPEYSYEEVIEATLTASLDAEINYYAHAVCGNPDVWNNVPKDIHDDVKAYMRIHGLEEAD